MLVEIEPNGAIHCPQCGINQGLVGPRSIVRQNPGGKLAAPSAGWKHSWHCRGCRTNLELRDIPTDDLSSQQAA